MSGPAETGCCVTACMIHSIIEPAMFVMMKKSGNGSRRDKVRGKKVVDRNSHDVDKAGVF
jgi:hypothetical protein